MNQIIAAVMLFGVVTAVIGPLIVESSSQIFSNSISISDISKSSRQQVGEILVATNTHQKNHSIKIYLSNIGISDIVIQTVLVDGIESEYTFVDQDSIISKNIPANELGVLEINGAGSAVQIITSTGKFFEFYV